MGFCVRFVLLHDTLILAIADLCITNSIAYRLKVGQILGVLVCDSSPFRRYRAISCSGQFRVGVRWDSAAGSIEFMTISTR